MKREEGLSLKPYVDTRGKTTIGYGRNLTDVGISGDEATYLLENDIADAQGSLYSALSWVKNLDEVRQAVLVNMTFNMGIRGLLSFHDMLAAIQAGNWPAAAAAIQNSDWWNEVGDRAKRLQQQLLTGAWQ